MESGFYNLWSGSRVPAMGPNYHRSDSGLSPLESLPQEVTEPQTSMSLSKSLSWILMNEKKEYYFQIMEVFKTVKKDLLLDYDNVNEEIDEYEKQLYFLVKRRMNYLRCEASKIKNENTEKVAEQLGICSNAINWVNSVIETYHFTLKDIRDFFTYCYVNFDIKLNFLESTRIKLEKDGNVCRVLENCGDIRGSIEVLTDLVDILNNEVDNKKIIPKFEILYSGEKELEQFSQPWGVCSDVTGRILIADRRNHKIKIFNESGKFLLEFGKEGSNPGEFNRPAGIAVDLSCRIIVIDKDNHRVQVFSYSGVFLFSFGKHGQGVGEFNYPWGVAVNNKGEIAVSDSKNCRVQIFNKEGRFIKQIIYNCSRSGPRKERECPRGLAYCPDGKLLITEFNFHKILIVDENYKNVSHLGRQGSNHGEFNRPQGIATDHARGRFAVADSKNYRIQIFDSHGNVYKVFGARGKNPGEFDCPQGICFHPNGNLIVADLVNNRIQVF